MNAAITGAKRQAEIERATLAAAMRTWPARILIWSLVVGTVAVAALPLTRHLAVKDREFALAAKV